MKVAIDTSVLVAGHLASHPQHLRAVKWMVAADRDHLTGYVTLHALAEVWSVLTKLPVTPRIEPMVARTVVMQIVSGLQVMQLSEALYFAALERCAEHNLRSGAIFDALHVIAAEQAGVDLILTLNEKDFVRLAKPSTPRILSPSSADAEGLLVGSR